MKLADMRGQSVEGLKQELEALHKERFGLNMQKSIGQLARSHRVREVRREIARIKTVLAERARVEKV
ncbi:MAG: 50S ribosomal protein L29 [Thioalkalivibrionaceae bacterium]